MSAGRDDEGLLALARRHVTDGTAAVARQEALVATLQAGANRALSTQAEKVLATLRTSLALMQQDLERLEHKHAAGRDSPIGSAG